MAIENEDPEVLARFPWQKAIIFLLSAIVFLSGLYIKKGVDDNAREKERVENFRTLYKEKENELKQSQRDLFDCKDEAARYFRKQDSTNRAVLDQPARDLLKQLNR